MPSLPSQEAQLPISQRLPHPLTTSFLLETLWHKGQALMEPKALVKRKLMLLDYKPATWQVTLLLENGEAPAEIDRRHECSASCRNLVVELRPCLIGTKLQEAFKTSMIEARKYLPQAAAYLGLEAVSQVIPAEADEPHVRLGKEFVQQLNSIPAFFASLA